MPRRPYTLLSCAVSVDGCLDDGSAGRLIMSGPEDLDEVDELRAAADAILVGAGTIRADDPRLLIRSPRRSAARQARGQPPHPLRVTLTATGDLDPAARFFTGPGTPLVYCASSAVPAASGKIGGSGTAFDQDSRNATFGMKIGEDGTKGEREASVDDGTAAPDLAAGSGDG